MAGIAPHGKTELQELQDERRHSAPAISIKKGHSSERPCELKLKEES